MSDNAKKVFDADAVNYFVQMQESEGRTFRLYLKGTEKSLKIKVHEMMDEAFGEIAKEMEGTASVGSLIAKRRSHE